MVRRVTSSTLIGRTDELATLRSAVAAAAAGTSQLVLVSGDAGIGKTRLLSTACELSAQDGVLAAVGGCVQLGTVSIAYAPLVEALRSVRAQVGDEAFAALVGSDSQAVPALLSGHPVATVEGSTRLFEHLLGFLGRLADQRPVLLVFEDLHWADASTRDLIEFLGRNLRDKAVLLVLTYRGDEVHRRHPLRPVLTDLERYPGVERIALGGLDRDDVMRLVRAISDEDIDVDGLVARSEGNPFILEELVASSTPLVIPASLADMILGRVARLPGAAQEVLHHAAVLGNEIDERLLASFSGTPPEAVSAALHDAVHDQLVVVDGPVLRFRHALIREAVYDDLLPGERERLHRRAADAVERSTDYADHARWAMLAYHLNAARDVVRAFEASVRAAVAAEKLNAYADAEAHYARALALRDQVADADERAGMTYPAMLLRAANAAFYSNRYGRALALAESALAELPPTATPEERAVVLERLGRIYWIRRRSDAAAASYQEAVALLADRPASREQAFALAALGQYHMLASSLSEAEPLLIRAIEVASQVDARDVVAHARTSLGPVLLELDQVGEALDMARDAAAESREVGTVEDGVRAYNNLVHCLYHAVRHDEACSVAAEGVEFARRAGLFRHLGSSIVGNWLLALYASGRWDEAEELGARTNVATSTPYHRLRWVPLLIGRGRTAQAREVVELIMAEGAEGYDVQFRAVAHLRSAELARAELDLDRARELVAEALEIAEGTDDVLYRPTAYALGVAVEADRSTRDGAEEEAAEAVRVAAGLLQRARDFAARRSQLPAGAAWLASVEVEYLRATGRDGADDWHDLAARWDELGDRYEAARARYHEVDAILRGRGDRAVAATVARQVLDVALRLGAVPLAEQTVELAARGRLDIVRPEDQPEDPLAQLRITSRERDVLRLLAVGMTNRQIGQELYISEKTASVHVTNLLRKLGVANRTAAAAIGQRVGL